MGGVQSGTHNLGDALWIQERQKQKCQRDGSRYDANGHGPQSCPQQQTSTQERRKLLKRTRSLAVISEDELRASSNGCDEASRFGSPYDRSTLQHRRPQLIPRAKLIDRNSLKDRLCKSQQHLTESYDYVESSSRSGYSRSLCGLYSLPPPLDSLPDPLPYTLDASTWRSPSTTSDRLNVHDWPDSPRRYRSVQDLNSVSGLVDVIEDNFWPAEENRSVDCIYTQVKRKRKEHRSLDSILFEDDSDELEYFDILNLLPLSNVRLEIDEPKVKNKSVSSEESDQICSNRESKSHPTILSALFKKSNSNNEKCSVHKGLSITEIEDFIPRKIDSDQKKTSGRDHSDALKSPKKKSVLGKNFVSFDEIAKEKVQCKNISKKHDNIFDENVKKESKPIVKSYYSKANSTVINEEHKDNPENNKVSALLLEKNHNFNEKPGIEGSEDNKIEIKEIEEMSRRPQVLKIIDNDITKAKNLVKSITPDVTFADNDKTYKEKSCESITNNQKLKVHNKPDIINDHIQEIKINLNNADVDKRLSVENARNFFEKKSADRVVFNQYNEAEINRTMRETSSMLGKTCNIVKDSLGFEARSESSDLGLGSETGSDIRRLSLDENTNAMNEKISNGNASNNSINSSADLKGKNSKSCSNLSRSRSCIDSIECQASDEPEFDHVRYKIVKPNVFSKNIINNSKNDVTYDGLMQYLREYSFQDLIMDNNVVIIEPVRAEVERKASFNEAKSKCYKPSQNSIEKIKNKEQHKFDKDLEIDGKSHFIKTPRQSSLRKHFFYQPIRVNRELNDDELPNPDTVRNVRKMFEETMKKKLKFSAEMTNNYNTMKSASMKDLRTIECQSYEIGSEKAAEPCRSRCSSRAKDLRKMFENMEKPSSGSLINDSKDGIENIKNESKTRTIVQSFECRSGQTSPSNSNSFKSRTSKYNRQSHNWDAGSVSSGVSSDYPDTDAGSALPCTSSEDEELYCQDDDSNGRYEGHYVSQDVLKKIREHGTSVTYYGGKVVNTYNGPLICPMVSTKSKGLKKPLDYVKFRLVKSNSCDSRLELTGRIENNKSKYELNMNRDKSVDLRQFTIDETPSIEIMSIEQNDVNAENDEAPSKEEKREPPVIIGLEPKKEENNTIKADFKLGKIDESTNRFTSSALTRWQINENTWKRNVDFGKMEFEEYEILEDSLNGLSN